MNTYYLREVYFATGEGATTLIAVGHANSSEDFLDLCEKNGIDRYYLTQPHIFTLVEKLDKNELDMLKETHPSLYKRIVNKCYNSGAFWWSFKEHFNMS